MKPKGGAMDRDQLTEARRKMLDRELFTHEDHDTVLAVLDALLDFPTDEMVEAHDAELRRLIPGVKGLIYRRASELMLEAVRRVMIGETE